MFASSDRAERPSSPAGAAGETLCRAKPAWRPRSGAAFGSAMNAATARHHAKMLMPRRRPRKNISVDIFDAVMTTPRCLPLDAEAVVPNDQAHLPGPPVRR